jgi:hypothetical protein
MGGNLKMSNIYYEPDEFGLEIVTSLDTAGSYEFDMAVVWKDEKGRHFIATDSGCSCPSPFEGIQDASELTRFNEDSLSVVEDALRHINASYSDASKFTEFVKASLSENV